jgi:hypothetical protein
MEGKLASTLLSEQDIRALLRNKAWNVLNSQNAQLMFIDEFALNECAVQIDSSHLGDVFDLTRDRVGKILATAKRTVRPPHLHRIQYKKLCYAKGVVEFPTIFTAGIRHFTIQSTAPFAIRR